ncbi:MAG: C-3',4' desaturase CrtD [Prochlorococcaceae cyanobacterium]
MPKLVHRDPTVAVIGGGIAGLTAAALLARHGRPVVLLEAHHQTGGCAGTFRRGPWTFDVGATQVAGLEAGGSHRRVFDLLEQPLPDATPLDPACVVDLGDGLPPVRLHRDPLAWQRERLQQFPGSDLFWTLCDQLHRGNWAFNRRLPPMPPRRPADLGRILGALGPASLGNGLLLGATVADLLSWTVRGESTRLRQFLDLQLRLYSQLPADRTAALYGATTLAMGQSPLGLWHLHGSMQCLSDALEAGLRRWGGQLRLQTRVQGLRQEGQGWILELQGPRGEAEVLPAGQVICTLPPQSLPCLLGEQLPPSLERRIEGFGDPSGAVVLYGAIDRGALPDDGAGHVQLAGDEPGSLFLSLSHEGDGRAPRGQATLIASLFTPARPWFDLDPGQVAEQKQALEASIVTAVQRGLGLAPTAWRHRELATPRAFARWTGRPWGFVGGLGQSPDRFGPFGLAHRSPLPGLWLCGDSLHPGEGTAGVSQGAELVVRQLLES